MRILIAEDEAVSRELLTRYLREWGHEPVVTRDGPEALQALWPEEGPRVAILDWMMPGLEGPEVVQRLRAAEHERGENRPIYFILLTAREATVDVVHAFRAGANDYIKKPFHKDELHARVDVGIRMHELQDVLTVRVVELEEALRKVHTLQGLLPICSYCKKIRDDQNYWTDVESYIAEFSDAEFSHGVCPDCFATHLQPRLDELRRAGVKPPSPS
ncbi:response regulator transcription factor, partial [bacterium]|nr:response regulator transcription factor [bacterium]